MRVDAERDRLNLEVRDLRIEVDLMTRDRDRLAEAMREVAEALSAGATIESEWVLPIADDLRSACVSLEKAPS